jgi:hypothetical protein
LVWSGIGIDVAAWPGLIDEFVGWVKSPPGERKAAAKKAAAASDE